MGWGVGCCSLFGVRTVQFSFNNYRILAPNEMVDHWWISVPFLEVYSLDGLSLLRRVGLCVRGFVCNGIEEKNTSSAGIVRMEIIQQNLGFS